MTFALNHLSYFLLTNLLRPLLEQSAPARIVSVASDAHKGVSIEFGDIEGKKAIRRLACLSAVETGEHPVHARAGAAAPRNASDGELASSRDSCEPASCVRAA